MTTIMRGTTLAALPSTRSEAICHANHHVHAPPTAPPDGRAPAGVRVVTGSRAEGEFPSYRWLSATRAAGQLGLTLRELYRLIDTGRLPAYRIAGELKLMADDVDRWRTRDHASRSGGDGRPDHPDPPGPTPGGRR